MLSAGSPQGCVLRPLLFRLLTHDCVSRYEGNLVIKYEDDITVVGLICRNDESMYRKEVERLVGWCRVNNPEDTDPARSSQYQRLPVERVEDIRFLGVQISKHLSWDKSISVIRKWAQQGLGETSLCPLQHPQDFLTEACSDIRYMYISVVFQLQYVRQNSTAEDS